MANYALLLARYDAPSNAQLDIFTRELWTGLNLRCADVQGRLLDNPALVLASIFPFEFGQVTTDQVEQALDSLAIHHWLLRYQVNGIRLIQILQWWEGNSIQYANPSKYPPPTGWQDRTRYNRKSKFITENWNGHKEQTPQIGLPFTPIVETLARTSTHPPTLDALPNGTESESESESESEMRNEKKSESASSSESYTPTPPTNCLTIFKALGASPVQIKYLEKTPGIRPEDLWAMAARTWNDPNIRKPAWITLQNILSGERASADWYEPERWNGIPEQIRRSGRLVIQGQEKEVDQLSLVATRNSETDPVAEKFWGQVVEQLREDVQRATFEHWIEPARVIKYEGYTMHVGVPNSTAAHWMTERMTSTIKRLLEGITNNPNISVEFISLEAQ